MEGWPLIDPSKLHMYPAQAALFSDTGWWHEHYREAWVHEVCGCGCHESHYAFKIVDHPQFRCLCDEKEPASIMYTVTIDGKATASHRLDAGVPQQGSGEA